MIRIEELRVGLVHLFEVLPVGQEDRDLDDSVQAASPSLEYRLDISQDLAGLLLDSTRDELARRRIEGPLT